MNRIETEPPEPPHALSGEEDDVLEGIDEVASLLKAMAHPARLKILCWLAIRERSVGELEHLLSERQPAVSQQLSRLREDNLVTTRRVGKQVYYNLVEGEAEAFVHLLHDRFCRKRSNR
ncbi:ArsR/SmtB family transcription factor [Rhodospirillum sp. A1_3_36]|uniref:ArsR/SmtB family transcription factor n=1 Tax=Rhodospirillum sp. A1_3_36 TaxID=3391666 RepID=UPI0039A576AD